MNNRPEIIFSFPACMGGVASLNFNLINYSKLKNDFYVKVILIKAKEDLRPLFLEKFVADETILFDFSYKDNQFYVMKRLSKLLGTQDGAIVCDNILTINSAVLFKCPKTIFHYLHDFFYVKQNIQVGNMVDVVVTHSSFFADCAFAADPENFKGRCFYIPYGVKQIESFPLKSDGDLKLVFLGRLDGGKGVMSLNEIDTMLAEKGIKVIWNIIGKGPLKAELRKQWTNNTNVSFHEPDTTKEIFEILKKQDLFIFPTAYEGTPVSILESISCGVVPMVSDLPGGIRDIVREGIGFRCELENTKEFVERIVYLNNDRALLATMQQNCFDLANCSFDIQKNADNYFELFLKFKTLKRDIKKASISLSRLDRQFLPNSIVKFLRKLV